MQPLTQRPEERKESVFDQFVGQYAISKTLRFELRPVGETLENMQKNLGYDPMLKTFLKDQNVENAYQALKPILDKIHEEFIERSLTLQKVHGMNFVPYFEMYQEKSERKENDFKLEEKKLRSAFDELFIDAGDSLKKEAGFTEKKKPILKEKGFHVLTEAGILKYIEKNADCFSDILSVEKIQTALSSFEGFFTYFTGFSQNRENYYTTKEEKATAVATRIVHQNLPKFCDNSILFQNKKNEYLHAYTFLREKGITMEIKNKKSGETKLLSDIPENIFSIDYFSSCFSQSQIERYNDVISNANFVINLYNQSQGEEKNKRLAHFKTLYKQIGCGKRETHFFILTHEKKIDAEKAQMENPGGRFFSAEEKLQEISLAGKRYFSGKSEDGTIETVLDFIEYLQTKEDFSGVYWSKSAMNTISNRYFSNWHELKDALKEAKIFLKAGAESDETVKIPDTIELKGLFSVLDKQTPENWRNEGEFFKKSLTEILSGEDGLENDKRKKIIKNAETPSKALLEMILADISKYAERFISGSEEILALSEYTSESSKEKIKKWLDDALTTTQLIKYFFVRENKVKGSPIDSVLSEGLKTLLESDDADWFHDYDAIRNFLTKKPQDDAKENKLKLNFENSTLAGGWDVNKESDNTCILLKSPEGKNFLAVLTKGNKNIFQKEWVEGKGKNKVGIKNSLYLNDEGFAWKKMEYKLLPGPNKMLPKCLLPKSDRKKYGATDEIIKIYNAGSFKKSDKSFSKKNLHILIDFYKEGLKRYEKWNCFTFSFRPTCEYEDISQFYAEVEKQGYKLDFSGIRQSIIDQWISEGKIYLFEIRNQDSNEGKQIGHKENLHTMYWKAIFEDVENRPKLNGQAEIFYRKAIPENKMEKVLYKNEKEIIRNFRFSKEKFLFHVPITLNFCLKNYRINDVVNGELKAGKKFTFLGIDRGEKHLAYYSLVNASGLILDQGTLNVPFMHTDGSERVMLVEKRTMGKGGEKLEMKECRNYNDLLDARAGDRDFARKNWKTIGTIKNLKDGYISQVVRKIVDFSVENDALIVLEDLNAGFMRGRQKIEKSVYQKMELALAKKLNFLVDKSAKLGGIGSVTKALQLTPPINNFGEIRKQSGIMLYTRANYTSQTDPLTGWRKTIYLKRGSKESLKKQILETFSEIEYKENEYRFTYTEKMGKENLPGETWTLYSGKKGVSLDRFRGRRGTDKNEWVTEKQNVQKMLDGLFVDFDKSRSLLAQIREGKLLQGINEYTAEESLRYCIDLIQQIRNTGEKGDERNSDFILSPVRDKKTGEHFDSRFYWDKEQAGEKIDMPSSGDANGAFNIARKGIVMSEHLKYGYKTYISDEEWSVWLSGKEKWDIWRQKNEKNLIWEKREK